MVAHQQQLQTIAENEPISSLPLSTQHSRDSHDSALYKSIIDIDIHITLDNLYSIVGLSVSFCW